MTPMRSTSRDGSIDDTMKRVPCTVMRGGTSRAVFFRERDLPTDPERRDRTILSVMGSPHQRQIDGLGGADTLTSKIAIISPASDDDETDVRYEFGQVSIERPIVDYDTSCGNISSAVGQYAIEEGIVEPEPPVTTVSIRDANSGLVLTNEVPIENDYPKVTGEYSIQGTPGTGARVNVGFKHPGGGTTGALLPTGSTRDEMTVGGRTIEYSYVDAANPCAFVRASDFGLDGTELPVDVDTDEALLEVVEEIRSELAVTGGLAADRRDALENKTVLPMVCFVGPPADYTDYEGDPVRRDDVSLLGRLMVNRRLHKAYAGTGTVCTGVASQLEGSIVHEFARPFAVEGDRTTLRIGHPSGTIDAFVEVDDAGDVEQVLFSRTARRLMDGTAYARPEIIP